MELRNVEIVKDLVFEFDREYTEIVSKSKTIITEFFEKIRELEENYFAGLQEEAMRVYERFGSGELDDACSEDTKLLLGDKDTFMNSVQSHHDFHASAIDALEDKARPGSSHWSPYDRVRVVNADSLRTFFPSSVLSAQGPSLVSIPAPRRLSTPLLTPFDSAPTFVALNDGPSTLISSRRKRGDGWTSSSTASGTGNGIGTACASRRSSR